MSKVSKRPLKQTAARFSQRIYWGKRRLAYQIKRHRDGYYALFVFESDPGFVRELYTYYRIAEPIIKYMIVTFEGEISESKEEVTMSRRNEDSDDAEKEF